MNLLLKFLIFIMVLQFSTTFANENFFSEAQNLFKEQKYDESKFLLQRNIVWW